ncbi:MAG: (2Fe-2S) ferredoxin domain-containing protein [Bacilli bacterium]
MEIYICVGSSCHLKGSHEIIDLLKEHLEKDNLTEKVTLRGTFCLGKCTSEGVNVKVNDEVITGIKKENFEQFYNEKILSQINQ